MSRDSTSSAQGPTGPTGEPKAAPVCSADTMEAGEKVTESAWEKDARNPMNWSATAKWTIVGLLWATNTVAAIASTAFEPAMNVMLRDLGTDNSALGPFSVSIYILGYCFGPLVAGPISELYGRLAILYPAFVLYMVTLVVCATSQTIAVFIVFRAVMGFAGIAFIICGGAIIADIIPRERRGLAMSTNVSAQTLGPTIGPIIGGYIVQSLGWRWVFWIPLAALGALMIAFLLILRETFPPIVNPHHSTEGAQAKTAREVLVAAWTRPLRFIFRTRLVPFFTLFTAIINSYLFIILATFGTIMEAVYGFSTGASGLAYLGMFVGFFLSQFSVGILSDMIVGGKDKASPERRLRPLILGSALLPVALLLCGWSLQTKVHWIVPVIGTGLIAFSTMYSYIPVQVYIVDVYTLHAASATGAMSIIRSAIAAVIPLAANPLYEKLGYGWAFTLLAGISVPFIGLGVLLIRWGKRIREVDQHMT